MVEIISEWARRIWASWAFWCGALTACVPVEAVLGNRLLAGLMGFALAVCAGRWQLEVAATRRGLCSNCLVALESGRG